jgi:hypothetical protein
MKTEPSAESALQPSGRRNAYDLSAPSVRIRWWDESYTFVPP